MANARTMGELIQSIFCEKGIAEASSVEVKLKDGTVLNIHSDNHPALNRSADEVASVTPRQTAQGGN